MRNVLTILLAGGAGERLHPLTRHRAKPAVPFGGIYRIVDITLSNCLNSDCRRVLVLVQYKSNSLVRHIRYAWNVMHTELGEYIDIMPPQKRVNDNWYLGTADAIYQNLYSIERENPSEVLIVSGDHIYKMDYRKMVRFHRESEADLTIAAIETPLEEASRFGVLQVARDNRVIRFTEKPEHPEPLPDQPDLALVSMGVYVFSTEVLRKALVEDAMLNHSQHDFGRDVIPRLIERHAVYAYRFEDENKKAAKYWRDIGTLDSYYEANMDLVAVEPQFNLYDKEWPLRTMIPSLPPAKFVFADWGIRCGVALDSIVSPGCIISGGLVRRCVLSPEVRINSYAEVEDSILMHGVHVGRYSRIRKAIIEKNVYLPDHTVIGYNLEEDQKRFRVTPKGVVIVEPTSNIQDSVSASSGS